MLTVARSLGVAFASSSEYHRRLNLQNILGRQGARRRRLLRVADLSADHWPDELRVMYLRDEGSISNTSR